MKKRISHTNIQVKKDMYKALLYLMKDKAFSSISVSDITSEAGVSRMAFYRNYSNIEDILIEYLDQIVEKYKGIVVEDDTAEREKVFYEKNYMLNCFSFFYAHHEFIDALIAAGMGDLFLAKITEYLIRKWIEPQTGTREEMLRIGAYAGSIYNMYREWSRDGFQEEPEEVAEILYNFRK